MADHFCLACSTRYPGPGSGLERCPHCNSEDRIPADSAEQVEIDGPHVVHLVGVDKPHEVKGYTASTAGISYKAGGKNFTVAWSDVDHVAPADDEPATAAGGDEDT